MKLLFNSKFSAWKSFILEKLLQVKRIFDFLLHLGLGIVARCLYINDQTIVIFLKKTQNKINQS